MHVVETEEAGLAWTGGDERSNVKASTQSHTRTPIPTFVVDSIIASDAILARIRTRSTHIYARQLFDPVSNNLRLGPKTRTKQPVKQPVKETTGHWTETGPATCGHDRRPRLQLPVEHFCERSSQAHTRPKDMGILALPAELSLECLEGLSIQDVINVAQTCSRLRSLVLSNRLALLNTSNSHAIAAPRGSAIADLSSQCLYKIALKSAAVSKRLHSGSPQKRLVSTKQSFYDMSSLSLNPPWRDWSPWFFFLSEDILAFRRARSVVVLKCSPCDSAPSTWHRWTQLDLEEEELYQVRYSISQDGHSLIVASVALYPTRLKVDEICLTDENFGIRKTHLRLLTQDTEMFSLSVEDPYVAMVFTDRQILIINWRACVGAIYELEDPDRINDGPVLEGILDNGHVLESGNSLVFRPGEPVAVFLLFESGGITLHTIDIPSDMPVIQSFSADISGWTIRVLSARSQFTHNFPNLNGLEKTFSLLGFRSRSALSWMFDIATEDVEHNPDFGALYQWSRKVISFRHSIDLSTRCSKPRRESVVRSLKMCKVREENFECTRRSWISDTAFQFVLPQGRFTILIPIFEDEHGRGGSFVHLELPMFLKNSVRQSEWWNTCLFDTPSGKLYVFLPTGIHVLQY
ncbi:hypothetical protein SISNIDRAFT_519050 [Sistotremastrum niveocremeum HHB9708]|uniref:F-box domain-containing protein n=1 Tax=Sistotremastrum niveocremeum HHB9708 TaxID=1314777 RepID=A0A164RRM1_9AGAM|nr:hypothetical protein SISNIDRAFT_519050 [Sistotremastrum niveocremeum HHB9708]